VHYRLVAQLSKRGADLGEVYFEGKAERQVAVLYQNDDHGKDYLKRLKDGLGAKAASMIVAEDAYEVAEPTIDSHAVKMKSLNADVFVDIATPKFTAQAIRKAAEISCVGTPGPCDALASAEASAHAGIGGTSFPRSVSCVSWRSRYSNGSPSSSSRRANRSLSC
jgi:ABC-type branched-subunit amino acid transport system substrate-binding protein